MDNKITIGSKVYEPLPKQLEFHSSGAPFKAYVGGVGSGKTKALCWEAILLSVEFSGNLGLIGRKTYTELRDSTMKQFFEECPEEIMMGGSIEKAFSKSELRLTFVNGSEIIFRSLDEIDKIKSLNLGFFAIDEGTETDEDMFKMLMSRLRRDNIPHRYGFLSSNPNGKDWVWRRFVSKTTSDGIPYSERIKKDWKLVHAPTTENIYLPEGYVSNLMDGYDDDWVQRYVYGEFNTFEGMVFKEFDRTVHVIQPFELKSHWPIFLGVDFGYNNPFATIFAAEDEHQNLYVFDEVYEREMLVDQQAALIREKLKGKVMSSGVADPSEPQMIQELGERGIYLAPANNNVMAGIDRVKKMLRHSENRKPKLFIFSNCQHLIFEMENYRWQPVKSGYSAREVPVKVNDHLCDATRYLIMGRPEFWEVEAPNQQKNKVSWWDLHPWGSNIMEVGEDPWSDFV